MPVCFYGKWDQLLSTMAEITKICPKYYETFFTVNTCTYVWNRPVKSFFSCHIVGRHHYLGKNVMYLKWDFCWFSRQKWCIIFDQFLNSTHSVVKPAILLDVVWLWGIAFGKQKLGRTLDKQKVVILRQTCLGWPKMWVRSGS